MNTDEKLLQILDNSACLRKGQVIGYLKGELYPEELRVVELHLSECSLCNDALEGLQSVEQLNTLIDRITIPELPYSSAAEKKIAATPETTSKKADLKANTGTDRSTTYASQKLPKVRNYSWVGGMGIAALLLLGSALIWQFELRNKTTAPELASIQGTHQQPLLSDSGQAEKQEPGSHPVSDVSSKQGNLKKEDSLLLAATVKRDSAAQNSGVLIVNEEKSSIKRDSGILAPATKELIQDSQQQSLAMNAKKESRQADVVKESDSDVKSSKSVQATSKLQSESKSPAEGSDFETGKRLFKQKKYASALLYLKSSESDKDHPNHWEAVYYSALCNKYLGKNGRAKRLFKRIVNADAPQKSAAEKQLEDMANAKGE